MENQRVFAMKLGKIYPLLVQKAERKNRTREEVDEIVFWLTGYDAAGLQRQLDRDVDYKTFFDEAPCMHDNRFLIRGMVCGVRVEEIEDDTMRSIRYLDKLVDELSRGRSMDQILRK